MIWIFKYFNYKELEDMHDKQKKCFFLLLGSSFKFVLILVSNKLDAHNENMKVL